MSLASEVAVLARVHWRTFRAKTSHTAKNSRLLFGTVGLFLVGYLVVGYFLFCQGLGFLKNLPGVGFLLTTRVLYMTYFFFLLMLVFSNAVLLYSGLFRGRETPWLLTTPISPRAIFLWKVIESFIVSSWGLAILSAPLLASVGTVFGADGWFYLKCVLVYPLLLLLPAGVAGLLVVALVRWWGRTLRCVLYVVLGFIGWRVVSGLLGPSDLTEQLAKTKEMADGMKKVLGFTEVTMNRFLPSAWMSEMMLNWANRYGSRVGLYGPLLLSWALMLGWLCTAVASRATYPAWNFSQQRKARRTGRNRRTFAAAAGAAFKSSWLNRLPLRRDTVALIRKDLKEFTRDTSQWIPCAVVFTLLLLYASNLNRAADSDPNRPLFKVVLSSLNLGVCSLTLSTLTTRFIFPMFSLEGRRLWVLGLSPVGMTRVFRQKLLLYSSIIGLFTGALMLLSGVKLGMSTPDIVFYCGAIILMSTGLTALALTLGVLFPNFHDASPAKIVSGFGGTLCLILNFIFILLFMGLFVWNGVFAEQHKGDAWAAERLTRMITSATLLVLLTATFMGVPMSLSLKKMKRVEMLGTI